MLRPCSEDASTKQYQIDREKQMVKCAASNIDTLVDSAVSACQIHIDQLWANIFVRGPHWKLCCCRGLHILHSSHVRLCKNYVSNETCGI